LAKITVETDAFPLVVSEHVNAKYPWGEMKLGQSFSVPFAEIKEGNIRNQASVTTRHAGGKKFVVIKHNDLQLYEVARII
jgi:hypothetical protein